VNLYAAKPTHSPDVETTVFVAKDNNAAREVAQYLLEEDHRTGYCSPGVELWRISGELNKVRLPRGGQWSTQGKAGV
jgi:hypothetical protein